VTDRGSNTKSLDGKVRLEVPLVMPVGLVKRVSPKESNPLAKPVDQL
jgi:hypothetical protein